MITGAAAAPLLLSRSGEHSSARDIMPGHKNSKADAEQDEPAEIEQGRLFIKEIQLHVV